jgi:hypothetical protein
MKCLGLHNKPTAEVHPGHMLTDPNEEEEEPRHYMEVSGRHVPAALPPVKKPACIEYEADWRQSQSGRLRKGFLPLPRFKIRTVQPVARSPHRLRYT